MLLKRTMIALVGILLTGSIGVMVSGCGSSNNDQGISFSLIGFFSAAPEPGSDELPAGSAGQTITLSSADADEQVVGSPSRSAVFIFIGIRNNLSNQFINADRAFMEYYIAGAAAQPPSSSVALNGILGPPVFEGSTTEGDSPFDSTLPPSFADPNGPAPTSITEIPIVPPAVLTWINLNRGSLPEPPFIMNVFVEASGVTSAGDVLRTNTDVYNILFEPDNIINVTSPSESDSSASE